MEEHTIIINGTKINYYEQHLNKPDSVFVFLHGWGANKESFSHIYHHEKDTPIIALDFPGFGKSDSLKHPLTIKDYANFVSNLLDIKAKDRQLVLIGHSLGGRILMHLLARYARHKENVRGVIFIDVPFTSEHLFLKRRLVLLLSKFLRFAFKIPLLSFLEKPIRHKIYTKFGSTDYYEFGSTHALKQTFKNLISKKFSRHCVNDLKNIKTFIIWGEHDKVTPPAVGKRAADLLNTQVYFIKDASHFPFADHPQAFFEAWDDIKKSL